MGTWIKNWMFMYKLAKRYSEKKGNLLIPFYFKTKNGYTYNKDGLNLGRWIQNQRQKYCGNLNGKLFSQQIDLLNEIGMVWYVKENEETVNNIWMDKYKLAKKYYEYYGNLNINHDFKTIDGINFEKNGIKLGLWIKMQKQIYNSNTKMTDKQMKLLEDLDIVWDKKRKWIDDYQLVKNYYEKNGNLNVNNNFKTNDGFRIGLWIKKQREDFKENTLSPEKINLLNQLGFVFCKPKDEEVIEDDELEDNLSQKELNEAFEELEEDLTGRTKKENTPEVTINEDLNDLINRAYHHLEKDITEENTLEQEENIPEEEVVEVKEVTLEPKDESIESQINDLCSELDDVINKMKKEKEALLSDYKNLINEKKELEAKSKVLDDEMNLVIEQIKCLGKNLIFNK